MSKILFTQEEVNKIIYLYTIEGKTQKEISTIMKYGLKPIIRILHENNVPTNTRRVNRKINEYYFSSIDSEFKAYLIGLLFADGSISPARDGHQASINLQLLYEDKNLLEFFKTEINSNGKIVDNKDGTLSFSVRSTQIALDLAQYNIIPNKTYAVTTLPTNIPQQFLKDFLRGYVDGDGSLYFITKNQSFHLSVTSHFISIVDHFCSIAYQLLNMPERITERKSTYYNNVAKITFNGKEAYLLADLLYKNSHIYCSRKYEKYLLAKNKF